MKKCLVLLAMPFLVSCAAVTGDPWRWLDDPEQQHWVDVELIGWGYTLRYSIPERTKGSTERVRSNPMITRDGELQVIAVTPESWNRTSDLATYNWDYWWGGFYKEKEVDFWLNISAVYVLAAVYELGEGGFLRLTPEQYVEHIKSKRWELWDGIQYRDEELYKYYKENHKVEVHTTVNGLTLIQETNPQLEKDFVRFQIPVGSQHLLNFGFFVRDLRQKRIEDPEWNASRWEMVYKILDTVTITPEPWPAVD